MERFNYYIDKVIFIALILVAITFPVTFRIANIVVGILVLAWVIKKIGNKEGVKLRVKNNTDKWIVSLLIALFLLSLTSLLYTYDLSLGLKFVEYKLSLLIIPVVIADLELTKVKVTAIFKCFLISVTGFSTIMIVNTCMYYFQNGELLAYEDFTKFNSIVNVHPIFISYYIFFAVLILVYAYIGNLVEKKWIKLLPILGFPLIITLVLAASKNVLVITFIAIALFFIINSLRIFKWKEILVVFASLGMGVVLISKIPMVQQRVNEVVELKGMSNISKVLEYKELTQKERESFNGTSFRIALWCIGYKEVINNDRVIFGLTPADSKALINIRYGQVGLMPWCENFNMHNQFLQVFVEFGLLGLSIYLLLIFFMVKSAFINRNYLYLIFTFGFLFFQLTESLLERNKGILFFVFFILILVKMNKVNSDENSNIRN